jgi:hypothetical protein
MSCFRGLYDFYDFCDFYDLNDLLLISYQLRITNNV